MPVKQIAFSNITDPVIKQSFTHLMSEMQKMCLDLESKTDNLTKRIKLLETTVVSLQTQITANLATLNTILDGDTLPTETVGGVEMLKTSDAEMKSLMLKMIKELKKMNIQFALMNDLIIDNSDLGD